MKDPRPTCPNREAHTPNQPKGYLAWHEWAARMARTQHQVVCSGCGRYEIWVPGRVEPDDSGIPPIELRLTRDSSGRQRLTRA